MSTMHMGGGGGGGGGRDHMTQVDLCHWNLSNEKHFMNTEAAVS